MPQRDRVDYYSDFDHTEWVNNIPELTSEILIAEMKLDGKLRRSLFRTVEVMNYIIKRMHKDGYESTGIATVLMTTYYNKMIDEYIQEAAIRNPNRDRNALAWNHLIGILRKRFNNQLEIVKKPRR